MMNEFCIEIEVGEASPLSFLSFDSVSPDFFGDLPALLALAVNFEGDLLLVLFGDPKVYPPILLGELPPIVICFFIPFKPGDSVS